jgi:hypothetical protein
VVCAVVDELLEPVLLEPVLLDVLSALLEELPELVDAGVADAVVELSAEDLVTLAVACVA